MDKILQELIDILNASFPETDTSNVTPESDLRTDLAISSFDMILLAVSIEDRFHIQLEEDFLPTTVADVCRYVQNKIS